MKKFLVTGVVLAFILASTTIYAITIKAPFKTTNTVRIIDSILPQFPNTMAKEWEGDYEPNDWDGSADPFPPTDWNGNFGILQEFDYYELVGQLDSTGFYPQEGGWYTGDTDLFGWSIGVKGIAVLTAYFSEPCDPTTGIYNVWWIAKGSFGNLYILDGNFNFIDGIINEYLSCPYEVRAFIWPDFEINPDTGETVDTVYIYFAGAAGDPTQYTLTVGYYDCSDDDDEDGHPDVACEHGWDCDDTNPNIHPHADEICDDGADNDCDGAIDDDDSECDSGICFMRSVF